MTNKDYNKNYRNLFDNYVAGFVHADGTFTNTLIKGKYKIYLNPRFIVKQKKNNLFILEEIKNKLNNKGNIKIENNGIANLTISNLKDIKNIVLPYFDKYQVRGNRYFSYLKFKLLVNILSNERIIYRSELWLFCIMLSVSINPMVPLSKQVRYLTNNEQYIINNNIILENIDYYYYINKYCPELKDISLLNLFNNEWIPNNSQPLTKEFICGLFDGDGSIHLRLINNSFGVTLQIVQDTFNDYILKELLLFFNNKGKIVYHKTEKSVSYFNNNTNDIYNIIIPKMLGIENINTLDLNYDKLDGLKIKLYKLYNFIEVYRLLENNSIKNKIIYDKVILLLYQSTTNSKNLTFEEWKIKSML